MEDSSLHFYSDADLDACIAMGQGCSLDNPGCYCYYMLLMGLSALRGCATVFPESPEPKQQAPDAWLVHVAMPGIYEGLQNQNPQRISAQTIEL